MKEQDGERKKRVCTIKLRTENSVDRNRVDRKCWPKDIIYFFFFFMAHTSAIFSALWIWCVCETQSYILKVFQCNSREKFERVIRTELMQSTTTHSATKRCRQVRRTQDMKIRITHLPRPLIAIRVPLKATVLVFFPINVTLLN